MPAIIRLATAKDAPLWLDLVQSVFGAEYPAKEVYDPVWIARELEAPVGQETWVAEVDGRINASISFLKPAGTNANPIDNLGRNLHRPESFTDGSADALLKKINDLAGARAQMVVARVSASDNPQQVLYENNGYVCVGFQPFKHMLQGRFGVLFYVRAATPILVTRLPLSESLPQISDLASAALEKLKISNPMLVRDGVTGYPLQSDLKIHEASLEDFELWRTHSQAFNPPIEMSGSFNLGFGLMRVEPSGSHVRSVLGQRGEKIVAGLAYYFDEHDRCARFVDSFSTDDLSTGALFQQTVRIAQEQFNAVYVEVDILATAPRLLKSAEQLGFVSVAYLPAFFFRNGNHADVVKMVKLNMAYALDGGEFTTQSRTVAEIVDRNFQDQKIGVAIIGLLRALPIFEGLGDGELRKIARLFTQKLYRPGERIFNKGDAGDEAFIVMRGQVDIQLEEHSKPVALVSSGKIFGELAFLDGAARAAYAVASQASILLVVHRTAFYSLVQREPHLGMVVMRNVAMDLSNKLRHANSALSSLKAAAK